ncbi:MAG: MFS transporter [Thermoleophilaceae bacterium]
MSTDPRFAGPTPFARLAAVQGAGIIGDACVTVSLAGSLFFTAPTSAARGSVLLYLALTLAPFSVIAPVVGPALDRSKGGRRMMIVVSCLGRMVLAFLLSRHLESPLLYPEAFGILVLGKAHSIAKSALVPGFVKDDKQLVEANSRLALISVIGAAAGGIPAAGLVKLFDDSSYALIAAAVVFFFAAVLALKLPRPAPEPPGETQLERQELHAPSIILAGSAFGLLRGAVGFYTFFVAFALKDSVFSLGVALVAGGIGGFLGVVIAPLLRRYMREEIILVSGLLAPALVGLFASRSASTAAFAVTALLVAVGAACGRVGFDSIMQRDAPDAVRGRSFARFETRFQLIWVVGGLLGLIPIAKTLGMFALALALGAGGISYLFGMRAAGERVERRRRRAERTRAVVRNGFREGMSRARRWWNRRRRPTKSTVEPPPGRPPARSARRRPASADPPERAPEDG